MNMFIRWQNPSAFYLVFLIILYIVLFIWSEKRSQNKLFNFFGKQVTLYLSQSVSSTGRRLQLSIRALGLLFIVIAIARPQAGEKQQEIKSEGIELMILADVSESMLSEDVKPSRLIQMKIELAKLLELMPGNKIGIIAFAGSSSLLSPLTTDPNALRMYIDSLDTSSVSSQGTNIETALSYAMEAFKKGGVTQGDTARTTRAVLVVSDGEDHETGALETAKKLASEGTRVYAMAYGTEKGGAIPTRDQYGNMTGYKKDSSGQPILSQVKGQFLQNLSEAGEGQFYSAFFNGDHLRKFTNDVSLLEKTQFQSNFMTQYEEKYGLPLSIGLILLFLSFFIPTRNQLQVNWTGRYEVNS